MHNILSIGNMYINLFAGSLYNCSDHRAIVTDSNWAVLCPPTEEVASQSLSLINDELPRLSPSKEIGNIMETPVCAYIIMFSIIVINDLNRLEIVEFCEYIYYTKCL